MYLIKLCPECKTKLRFPIDKGTIRVKCACGYSFVANPDDTGIYRDASFDLSHTTPGLKKMTPLRRWIGDIQVKGFVPFLITGALNLKYKIQNFPSPPGRGKEKNHSGVPVHQRRHHRPHRYYIHPDARKHRSR